MRYLILGANGQLGTEFSRQLSIENCEWVGMGKGECDVSDLDQVMRTFDTIKPDIVINCAAYNLVDEAEKRFHDAIKVNGTGARNVASACRRFNAFLVHYSSDYVFDGRKKTFYTEDDEPHPINNYGKSKLLGERSVKEETDDFLIFRVSWVYGRGKRNFIEKVVSWARGRESIDVSCDEVSVPTSTRTIVKLTLKALRSGLTGLFHLTNSGYASRYEWAKEVILLKGIDVVVHPVPSRTFNLPARRPKFSAMSNRRLAEELNVEIPDWREEVAGWLK